MLTYKPGGFLLLLYALSGDWKHLEDPGVSTEKMSLLHVSFNDSLRAVKKGSSHLRWRHNVFICPLLNQKRQERPQHGGERAGLRVEKASAQQ